MSILDKITLKPLPADQYFDEEVNKTMIFLHHTASSPSANGVLEYWKSTSERVATAFIISGAPVKAADNWKDGDIIQCFGSGKWAWHLGLKPEHLKVGGPNARNDLNKISIGIEICNWGGLTKTSKGFMSYANVKVSNDQVCELAVPFKGFKFYQKYTDAQIDNTFELLQFLGKKWNIPLKYKGDRIFDICPECLQGESGVFTHNSCRPDKFDIFPQPEIIDMLQSL